MRVEILMLALMVGAANWVFRYGPLRLSRGLGQGDGPLPRFLAATGPAAIATLVIASVWPLLQAGPREMVQTLAGIAAILALWLWRRSVMLSTLGGSAAYAAMGALLAFGV